MNSQRACFKETTTFITIDLGCVSAPENDLALVTDEIDLSVHIWVHQSSCTGDWITLQIEGSCFAVTGYESIGSIRICGIHIDISHRHWNVV